MDWFEALAVAFSFVVLFVVGVSFCLTSTMLYRNQEERFQ